MLDAFNTRVRECDAVERFNADTDAYLTTNNGKRGRCRRLRCDKKRRDRSEQKVRYLLDDMTKLHVTRQEMLSAQMLFVDLAICSRDHCKESYLEIVEFDSKAEEDDLDKASDFSTSLEQDHDPKSLAKDDSGEYARTSVGEDPIGCSISALDKFNGIFPDAEKWFKDTAVKCLWKKETNGGRCGHRIAATNRSVIQELFDRSDFKLSNY
ncbi:MAG: hypothetical protein Q9217_006053 [Psora testacea]